MKRAILRAVNDKGRRRMADTKLRLGLDDDELERIRRTWNAMRLAVGSSYGIASRRGATTAKRVLGLATASLAGLPCELALSAATAVATQVSTGVNLGVPGSVLLIDCCISVRKSGKVSIRQADRLPFTARVVGRDLKGHALRGDCFLVVDAHSATLIVPEGVLVRTAEPEKTERNAPPKRGGNELVCCECGSRRVEPAKQNPYGYKWYCPVCDDGVEAWTRSKWRRVQAERGFGYVAHVPVKDPAWSQQDAEPEARGWTQEAFCEPEPEHEGPVCCACGKPAHKWDRPNTAGFTGRCTGTCDETLACESGTVRLACRRKPAGVADLCG